MKAKFRLFCLTALLMLVNINSGLYAADKLSGKEEKKIRSLISKMSLEEKVSLLHGNSKFYVEAIPRLGIPELALSDGPHGVRAEINRDNWNYAGWTNDSSTYFPTGTALAASWNIDLARLRGEVLGEEARFRGKDILLGPGVNIIRSPLCGRNFEYMSEDPYLVAQMTTAYIQGLQSRDVAACVKHYIANNQETDRATVDVNMSDRALHEIYLPAFKAAVQEAGTYSIMTAYNKFRGFWCAENPYLLDSLMRQELGFDGIFVSDWNGTHSTLASARAGLDLEMPSSHGYNTKRLLRAYEKGEITEDEIDRSEQRICSLVNKFKDQKPIKIDYETHHELVREIARHSIVMLKNDDVLPFANNEKIAVIGEFARKPRIQGGGSSSVNPVKIENVLGELKSFVKSYAFFPGYTLADDGYDKYLMEEAVKAAKSFDKILVIAGLPEAYESESYDRKNISLPSGQLQLIEAVAKANPNIVVALYAGSPVALPFIKTVKGIIFCHLLGAAAGKPLLEIVFGSVSPCGRLATTFPRDIQDDPTTRNFADGNNAVWYAESIYVGYRYYTTFNKTVLFPFGYGLSYTEFQYSDLKVDSYIIEHESNINISFKIKNIGKYSGYEVIQIYIENNKSDVYKPLRELRAFDKIYLNGGEEKNVSFELEYNDFAYYDINMKRFHVNIGRYKIQVAKNVNDIIMETEVERKENDPDYISHKPNVYLNGTLTFSANDFNKILGRSLPPKSIKRKRPYSMNATLNDLKRTLIGKLLTKIVRKTAIKMVRNESETTQKIILKSIMETPVRTLAIMSGGAVKLKTMELILRLINFGGLGK